MGEEYNLAADVEQVILKHVTNTNLNDLQRLNYLRTIETSVSLMHTELVTKMLETQKQKEKQNQQTMPISSIRELLDAAKYFLAEYKECSDKGRMSIDCDNAATALSDHIEDVTVEVIVEMIVEMEDE